MPFIHRRPATEREAPARTVKRSILIKTVTSGFIACVLATAGLVATASPSWARGAGRMCMFNAVAGAVIDGHVGWAFDVPGGSEWIYGSTDDDPAGDFNVPPGQNNGAWSASGNWNQVLSTFRNSPIGYNTYRCISTPTSAVGGALNIVHQIPGWGYNALGNNCLDDAYRVLNAYRGGEMPAPPWAASPDDYYVGLNWGTYYSL